MTLREKLIEAVCGYTKKEYYSVCGDGHSIWNPDELVKDGFPPEWIQPMVYREKAGPGKYDLYDNSGKSVEYIDGVYGGTFVTRLADDLGVDTEETKKYFGRGKIAQIIAAKIETLPEINFKEDQSNYGEGA